MNRIHRFVASAAVPLVTAVLVSQLLADGGRFQQPPPGLVADGGDAPTQALALREQPARHDSDRDRPVYTSAPWRWRSAAHPTRPGTSAASVRLACRASLRIPSIRLAPRGHSGIVCWN